MNDRPAADNRQLLENKHLSGAAWFYWIAALSVVNSLVAAFGGQWNFVVGLGITQFFDAIAHAVASEFGTEVRLFALPFDLGAAAVFVLLGVLARKRFVAAYVVGLMLYAADGLLFLLVQDWLGFGFHGLATVFIIGGLHACRQLRSLPEAGELAAACPSS
ncbi:MAG: hypothetical protein JSV80_13850 [Acidobacteriota bacterium]|nr:MAG: hypothetical protein JSV80_13850 [Acidobacteriota bacterium]